MSERWSNVSVGIFVLAALAILVVSSLWLLGSSAIVGERTKYHVLLDDAGGVEVGDRVRLAGVSVGRIQGIVLRPDDDWPVLLEIDIKSDVSLHQGTTATLSTIGLMGATFLQLVPGPSEAPTLAAGGTILGGPGGGFDAAFEHVDVLSAKLADVLDQTADLLSQVSDTIDPLMGRIELLVSEENVEDITHILASAEATLAEVEPRVGPLLAQMQSMAASVTNSTDSLPELIAEIKTLVDSLNTALGPGGQRIEDLLAAAEGTLGSADDALSVIGDNRATFERMLVDLQDAMANLERFSRQVRQRPSSLVWGGAPKDRRPGDPLKGGGR